LPNESSVSPPDRSASKSDTSSKSQKRPSHFKPNVKKKISEMTQVESERVRDHSIKTEKDIMINKEPCTEVRIDVYRQFS
jgi:hypothetical protein